MADKDNAVEMCCACHGRPVYPEGPEYIYCAECRAAAYSMTDSRIKAALALIEAEAERAVAKHPPLSSAHEGYAVIEEEFIELRAEVFKGGSAPRDAMAMRTEAVQLGAMAVRFLVDVCAKHADVPVPLCCGCRKRPRHPDEPGFIYCEECRAIRVYDMVARAAEADA